MSPKEPKRDAVMPRVRRGNRPIAINAKHVPMLNRRFVLRALPKRGEKPNKKEIKFFTFVKTQKPDPDPAREKLRQQAILKDHKMRLAILKRDMRRRANGHDDFSQRISIFCECKDHRSTGGRCPILRDMQLVTYELSDEEEAEANP